MTFFIMIFYKIFIKLRSIVDPLKLFTGSFCDISQPFKLFIPNIGDMTILYFYNNFHCKKNEVFH